MSSFHKICILFKSVTSHIYQSSSESETLLFIRSDKAGKDHARTGPMLTIPRQQHSSQAVHIHNRTKVTFLEIINLS